MTYKVYLNSTDRTRGTQAEATFDGVSLPSVVSDGAEGDWCVALSSFAIQDTIYMNEAVEPNTSFHVHLQDLQSGHVYSSATGGVGDILAHVTYRRDQLNAPGPSRGVPLRDLSFLKGGMPWTVYITKPRPDARGDVLATDAFDPGMLVVRTGTLAATAKTGLITGGTGGNSLVGSAGTAFLTQVAVGDVIVANGGDVLGTVAAVPSNSLITLTANVAKTVSDVYFTAYNPATGLSVTISGGMADVELRAGMPIHRADGVLLGRVKSVANELQFYMDNIATLTASTTSGWKAATNFDCQWSATLEIYRSKH